MNTFEIWESVDGYEQTLLPTDSPEHEALTTDDSGRRMRQVRAFQAASWLEALEEFRKHADVANLEDAQVRDTCG